MLLHPERGQVWPDLTPLPWGDRVACEGLAVGEHVASSSFALNLRPFVLRDFAFDEDPQSITAQG